MATTENFIDFHAHLHPTQEAKTRLLTVMDALGIVRSVVVAGGVAPPQQLGREPLDAPIPNETIRLLCEDSIGRLLPFYFANPYERPDEYSRVGASYYGLKLGPIVHGLALTDLRYSPYLQIARNLKHPVYLHCLEKSGSDVPALLEVANQYPDLVFILGHAGIGNMDFSAVDRILPFPKIYFETSGGFASVIRYAIDRLGLERILFGTEYPLQAPEIEIEKMRILGIEASLLNRNARRILRRTP